MHFLQLTFLCYVLSFFSGNPGSEYSTPTAVKTIKSMTANPTATKNAEPRAKDVILQSTDGGQTWQDISHSLPEDRRPEDFFAGESDIYLRVKNEMYRSKTNLKTPVWEKELVLDPRCTSIAFNRSGVMAYSYAGQVYHKMPAMGTWMPIYSNFKEQSEKTIFETADGTIFLGCEAGLYKSVDRGQTWKQVIKDGWVMELVESEGVLIGTSQKGIMRSTDNGEHWEWVISEGGVGIAVERIDGGFAAISSNSSTFSRRIRISMDSGKTWTAIDDGLQPSLSVSSIKQMGKYLICGHPDGIFRSSDMGKTWDIVHYSVDPLKKFGEGKVFTIYTSAEVLYAVARDPGC